MFVELKSGDREGQGRSLVVVVGWEMRGVGCCVRSGVVVLNYSAIQRLMREIKQQSKTMRFLFLNTTCKRRVIWPENVVVVVVVVAFSSLSRIWGECSTIHCPTALFFFFFLKWRLARAR